MPRASKRVLPRVYGGLELLQFLKKFFHGEGGSRQKHPSKDPASMLSHSEAFLFALISSSVCMIAAMASVRKLMSISFVIFWPSYFFWISARLFIFSTNPDSDAIVS